MRESHASRVIRCVSEGRTSANSLAYASGYVAAPRVSRCPTSVCGTFYEKSPWVKVLFCVFPVIFRGLCLSLPRQRIGQRRGATRALHWGQDRSMGRLGCSVRSPSLLALRDWPQSDKPSQQEAATAATWMFSAVTSWLFPGRNDVGSAHCDVSYGNPAFHSSIRALSPSWDSKGVRLPHLADEHEAQCHYELASQPEA